jgi:hypothetical protein
MKTKFELMLTLNELKKINQNLPMSRKVQASRRVRSLMKNSISKDDGFVALIQQILELIIKLYLD